MIYVPFLRLQIALRLDTSRNQLLVANALLQLLGVTTALGTFTAGEYQSSKYSHIHSLALKLQSHHLAYCQQMSISLSRFWMVVILVRTMLFRESGAYVTGVFGMNMDQVGDGSVNFL